MRESCRHKDDTVKQFKGKSCLNAVFSTNSFLFPRRLVCVIWEQKQRKLLFAQELLVSFKGFLESNQTCTER